MIAATPESGAQKASVQVSTWVLITGLQHALQQLGAPFSVSPSEEGMHCLLQLHVLPLTTVFLARVQPQCNLIMMTREVLCLYRQI